MDQVSLGEYRGRAVSLVEAGQFEEALRIAEHILHHYPEYVEGHLVLGRAFLGLGRVREAADQFAHVLGADPESAAALAGLSIVHQALGNREEAVGQMRRAFELCPGDAGLRRHLGDLLAWDPASAGQRPEITPAALARIYARNGLNAKAIHEFGSVLTEDPRRHDALLGQAELLWRDGRCLEAAEVCHQVLGDLPNALKANLILGALWLDSPQPEEARAYLALARRLDPENAVASSLFGARSPLPVLTPMLDRWEESLSPASCSDIAARVGAPEMDETPLIGSHGEEAAPMSDHTRPEEDFEIPDWLKGVGYEPPAAEPAAIEDAPATQAVEQPSDWLSAEHQDVAATPTLTETPRVKVERSDLSDWLREAPSHHGLPDRPAEEPALFEEPAAVEQPPQEVSEVVVWPAEGTEPVTVVPPAPVEPADAETPAWLRELQEAETSGQRAEPIERDAAETPEWLRRLREDIAKEMHPQPVGELDQGPAVVSAVNVGEESLMDEESMPSVAAPLHEEALAARPDETKPEPVGGEAVLSGPEETVAVEQPPTEEAPAEIILGQSQPPAVALQVEDALGATPAEAEASASPVEVTVPPEPIQAEAPPAGLVEAWEPSEGLPKDAAERLSIARTALEAGSWPQALSVYASLVSSADLLDAAISDLEEGIRDHPDDYLGHQVVGDAYMKDGRLSDALRAYRTALTKLH
jgi:tetratricopeptide (TPR) repeat protein